MPHQATCPTFCSFLTARAFMPVLLLDLFGCVLSRAAQISNPSVEGRCGLHCCSVGVRLEVW